MRFRGAASQWISSLNQPNCLPWPDFCQLLHDRFGRDQRDMLVRQMFNISQASTLIMLNGSLPCSTSSKLISLTQITTTRFVDG